MEKSWRNTVIPPAAFDPQACTQGCSTLFSQRADKSLLFEVMVGGECVLDGVPLHQHEAHCVA